MPLVGATYNGYGKWMFPPVPSLHLQCNRQLNHSQALRQTSDASFCRRIIVKPHKPIRRTRRGVGVYFALDLAYNIK